jgi:HEAT repeat protein
MPARVRVAVLAVALAVSLVPRVRTAGANGTGAFKRLSSASADELERQLADVPMVGLMNSAPTVLALYHTRMREEAALQMSHALLDAFPLLEVRPDLRTLPLRRGDTCKLTARAAATLESLSRKLRVYLDKQAPLNRAGERPELPRLRTVLKSELQGRKPEWLRPEAIPTLLQLLMHESQDARLMLVELLEAIPGKASTTALARRAVFDLDPDVRQAAITALRKRPQATSRRVFLELLRYPWPPAAEHAAEALVNLPDRGAIGQLVASLNDADAAAPVADGNGGSTVRELVRVHHVTNCILCHPPAATASDPLLGIDPVLTANNANSSMARAVQQLVAAPGADSYSSDADRSPALIRADVTYLRQDFSVLQAPPAGFVASPQSGRGALAASAHRFDFLVRKRPISKKESDRLKTDFSTGKESPQRAATLFALRELAGRDAGTTYADWLKQHPDARDDAEAARLSVALIQSRGDRRDQLLSQYRDGKGVVYTLALAEAIANVEGNPRDQVRDVLVQRLSRMTVASLRDRLREEEPELRRAAAIALGHKGDRAAAPDLIALLDDSERDVAEMAAAGLRELTGKSYSDPQEWRDWWRTRDREASAR